MYTKEIDAYIRLAKDTKVFSEGEISILEELLEDIVVGSKDYILIEETDEEGLLKGFAVIGRTPMTEFAWDIYWLITNPLYQRQGIASLVLKRIEEFVLNENKQAVLRVETSSLPSYEPARKFYSKNGFKISGLIENFYGKDNDLLIYTKRLNG